MELRDYFGVLRRRWPVLGAIFLLVFAVAVFFSLRGPRAYEATLRLAVSVGDAESAVPLANAPAPPPRGAEAAPYTYYREYYLWLASEYLADDLSEIIQSEAFAKDLAATIHEDVDPAAIRDVVRVRKTHRILDVSVQGPTDERALRLANGIVATLDAKGPKYVAQLSTPSGHIIPINEPRVRAATSTGNRIADLGLRALLALLIAVFAAFIMEYLDSTMRSNRDVRRLGLPVLGEIPVESA